MSNSLKSRLKSLPISKKMILVGSFLSIVSVFLPWYRDIDRFETGDLFLGITGPMYLGGIIVLLAAIASFGLVGLRLMDRPVPKLPLQEAHFHIFANSVSILMLVLTLSVYFHSKFGVNLTDKSAGIGLMLAFAGSAIVIFGALVSLKARAISHEEAEERDPVMDFINEDRMPSSLDKDAETKTYDHGAMAVKNASHESIEEFTNEIK